MEYDRDKHMQLLAMVDAVNYGNVNLLARYLEEGVDPNIRATDGCYSVVYGILSHAWEFATSNECIKLLVNNGLDTTDDCALHYVSKAIDTNNFEIASFLLGRGVDVNAQLRTGERMLTRAVSERMAWGKQVKYLLDQGACIEGSEFMDRRTPLMIAAELPDKEHILTILLDRGANINAQDRYGKTALIRAIEHKKLQSVRVLIARGADKTIVDVYGFNALHYAKQRERSQFVELLSG